MAMMACAMAMGLLATARAAVTVGAFAADELLTSLRSSIFVETAFLEETEASNLKKQVENHEESRFSTVKMPPRYRFGHHLALLKRSFPIEIHQVWLRLTVRRGLKLDAPHWTVLAVCMGL